MCLGVRAYRARDGVSRRAKAYLVGVLVVRREHVTEIAIHLRHVPEHTFGVVRVVRAAQVVVVGKRVRLPLLPLRQPQKLPNALHRVVRLLERVVRIHHEQLVPPEVLHKLLQLRHVVAPQVRRQFSPLLFPPLNGLDVVDPRLLERFDLRDGPFPLLAVPLPRLVACEVLE